MNVIVIAYDDVRIIERLFSSSLTALVSNQAPRKLKVCHFKKGTEICSYSFANTILAVKLNRLVSGRREGSLVHMLSFQRLIVCLEESIYIHNMRDMKVLHTIRDVPSNRDGLCALSSNSDNSFLAYPGSSITGEVQIFDTLNLVSSVDRTDSIETHHFVVDLETGHYDQRTRESVGGHRLRHEWNETGHGIE